MRDDFTQATAKLLAKRVGFRCSNPECRKPTSGPGSDGGTVSVGVAAHITAASAGGPRFNKNLSQDGRRAAENGIWLCQQCSRLIDADEAAYEASDLIEWKTFAEAAAALELRGYVVRKGRDFVGLEVKMPDLIEEMRTDLRSHPLTREIIVLSQSVVYFPGDVPFFVYYHEDHDELLAKLQICEHYDAIYDVSYNDVPRWNLREDFAEYLLGE